MGYIVHHAIVVTAYDAKHANRAAREARRIGAQVLGPSKPIMNGYRSLLGCPDGSKEGWKDSDNGDLQREEFISWLTGESGYEWAEVRYGSDDAKAAIVSSAWS